MARPLILALVFSLGVAGLGQAQENAVPDVPDAPVVEPHMDIQTLAAIILALDPDARVSLRGAQFTIDNVPVTMVADVVANRMRLLVPVASAAGLSEADLMRVMQANFDTALDARYAVANGRLWSVFIHPLAQLERAQFVSGVAQTVTLARNYGSSYASGGPVFGGGDSGALFQELLDQSEEI